MRDQKTTELDLSPAHWLWLPGQRTLPNTLVVFRRALEVHGTVRQAAGLIFADSRYLLKVNGQRVQWGPAPADPRWPEVDPVDLAPFLKPGLNEITVEVLWFGHGDGTYVPSNPGFIFKLDLEDQKGRWELVSDSDWRMAVDRSLRPGGHAQFALRALQEKRDLRIKNLEWMEPAILDIPPDKPTICGPTYPGGPQCLSTSGKFLRPRLIPLMREELTEDCKLTASGRVVWKRSPGDWFDFRIKDALTCIPEETNDPIVEAATEGNGAYLTFTLPEIMVGWPEVEVVAPEGTVIEMIYQESHDPVKGPWLDTMHYCWSRFVCADGMNSLSPFDYYSMRFLQLHIHENAGPVRVMGVRFRRRSYPFAQVPSIRCSEAALQRLFEANLNSLRNSIQECNTDAIGRERQQYSGDCGYQQHPVRLLFGETGHGARYLRTWADGQSVEGYFMDCWPGVDRLVRLGQRLLGITPWGPILDHGIGFVFDCYNHWMETGQDQPVRDLLPQLIRFGRFLSGLRDGDGLVPAEHERLGLPSVWMDHEAYTSMEGVKVDNLNDARSQTQRRKTGSFNLYAASMFRHALVPLCLRFGETAVAAEFQELGDDLELAVRKRFWSGQHGLFIDNLPWAQEEKVLHCSDRTLAMGVLFNLLDEGQSQRAADLLESGSDGTIHVGWSYIVNAVWRHRALIHASRIEKVLGLLRHQWGMFRSIEEGNAIPEHWNFSSDSRDLWSHCAVAPLVDLVEGVAGITPIQPGYETLCLRPQPGDIANTQLVVHIPQGPVHVSIDQGEIHYAFSSVVRWQLNDKGNQSEGNGRSLSIKRDT